MVGGPIFSQNRIATGKGMGMPGVHRGGGICWIYDKDIAIGPIAPIAASDLYKKIGELLDIAMDPPQRQELAGAAASKEQEAAITAQLKRFGYLG